MFDLQQYLSGATGAAALFSKKFENLSSEVLWVAHVSTDLRCLKMVNYRGSDACVVIPIREIISDVLETNSAGIILAHNHLSQDLAPSAADIMATAKLCSISRDMNFTVLDHLVFSGKKWSSMRQCGLM